MKLKGISASKGIVIGNVKIYEKQKIHITKTQSNNISKEIDMFENAREYIVSETEHLMKKALDDDSKEIYEIMEAHKEILCDSSGFIQPVHNIITESKLNCSYAVFKVLSNMAETFKSLDSEYMKERASDIEDIRDSIIRNIQGITSSFKLSSPSIIAAHDMTPSDTAKLDFSLVQGIITEIGGQTCHTAIMARTMGIPAIVSADGIMTHLEDNQCMILDGTEGLAIIKPSDTDIDFYQIKINQLKQDQNDLNAFIGRITATKDSQVIKLSANIGIDNSSSIIKDSDAEGVGLVRTEFLFMQRENLPTVNEQLAAYKSIIDASNGNTVTFRTLDAGGDKALPALNLKSEENPFLGLRAVRISLKFKKIFKEQLKALFIAGNHGQIRIMIPMISSCEEIDSCIQIINEVKKEMTEDGYSYNPDIPIGIMIEIPAAAILSDVLAQKVDFFSIGTNDLIQYTIAADRGNADVSNLYTPYHPSVIRLIKKSIYSAFASNIPCSMCGEAAGDVLMIPLLIGLGLRSFSVSPSDILSIRRLISNLSYSDCKSLANEIMLLTNSSDIKSRLIKYMEEKNEK